MEALDEILKEMDNVRAAWHWAVDRGYVQTIKSCVEPLACVAEVWSWYPEVQRALEDAARKLRHLREIATCSDRHEEIAITLASVLSRQAGLCQFLWRYDRAIGLCEESLALVADMARGADRDAAYIHAIVTLGRLLRTSEHASRAGQLLKEAVSLAEDLGDPWAREHALFYAGNTMRNWGRYAEAEKLLEGAIAIANETGERYWKSRCLDSLSRTVGARGDHLRAGELAREALLICQDLGYPVGTAYAHIRLGEAATAMEEFDRAELHYQTSLAIADEVGDLDSKVETVIGQGWLASARGQHEESSTLFQQVDWVQGPVGRGCAALALGQVQEAGQWLREGLRAAMEIEFVGVAQRALIGLAELLGNEGNLDRAAQLLSLALRHPATTHMDRQDAQRLLHELEAKMLPAAFAFATEHGEMLDLEEVVAELLECSTCVT
jgi:tetratricopeptide (TPR) repeat protein